MRIRASNAAIFIWLTAFLDTLAFGIAMPVLPRLVTQMLDGRLAVASWWIGMFGTTFAAAQFIFAPLQGALSDRFGRRPVVLASNCGMSVNFIFLALAPSLWWLLAARVIVGMTAASFATANAYVADTTPPDKRLAAFGMIGSAYGLGFIFGPAIGGILGDIGIRLPFWVASGLAMLNFLYGLFVLPESLPPEKRAPRLVFKDINPLGALRLLRRNSEVFGLSLASFLTSIADCVLLTVFVLYAGYRFAWNARTLGLVFTALGVCEVVVRVIIIQRIAGRLPERWILLIGLTCGAGAYVIMGMATDGWIFLLGIPLVALASLANPSMESYLTRHVGSDEQGRLQAASASLTGLASIIGPYLFAELFAHLIAPGHDKAMAGLVFIAAAALLSGGTLLAARATRQRSDPASEAAGNRKLAPQTTDRA